MSNQSGRLNGMDSTRVKKIDDRQQDLNLFESLKKLIIANATLIYGSSLSPLSHTFDVITCKTHGQYSVSLVAYLLPDSFKEWGLLVKTDKRETVNEAMELLLDYVQGEAGAILNDMSPGKKYFQADNKGQL